MIGPEHKSRRFSPIQSCVSAAKTAIAILVAVGLGGCDAGLAPPDELRVGIITGTVTYVGEWPPESEFRDIRFVALRFVPADTADFLQLNRMAVSDRLTYGASTESYVLTDVEAGLFPFSGIARQRTTDIFSWGPIGLYTKDDGVFRLDPGQTVQIDVTVDFDNPPAFPKSSSTKR